MIQRCTNPDATNFELYGGRGISVCWRWLAFENFLTDMGERPEGKTLDRYPDANGNYELTNCRWATKREQAQNRSTNQIIEIEGRRQCLTEWCRELKVPRQTVLNRVQRRRVSFAAALAMPYHKGARA